MRVVVGLVVAAALAAGAFLLLAGRDERLPARDAERALAARVGGSARFQCSRLENDGSIGLDDVDYVCERLDDPAESGYWIGTDSEGITELQPTG